MLISLRAPQFPWGKKPVQRPRPFMGRPLSYLQIVIRHVNPRGLGRRAGVVQRQSWLLLRKNKSPERLRHWPEGTQHLGGGCPGRLTSSVLQQWPSECLAPSCAFRRNANSLPHPYFLSQKLNSGRGEKEGLTVCFNTPPGTPDADKVAGPQPLPEGRAAGSPCPSEREE